MSENRNKEKIHELGRVSIVNFNGITILDQFIRPKNRIINYLTKVSGLRPSSFINQPYFEDVKEKVYYLMQIYNILRNRVIVGHSLQNDFKVLDYEHKGELRDLGSFKFMKENNIHLK